jgi:hypothetical protein
LTLLALAGLTWRDSWASVTREPTRPHDIIAVIIEHYGPRYKENTRESVRKEVLHQFAQAAIAIANEDDPSRPTNSPNYNYRMSREAAVALSSFGTARWTRAAKAFREECGSLSELYAKHRESTFIEATLPGGRAVKLSPGSHNALQVEVIEKFIPMFAPGAEVLYLGDTAQKALIVADEELDRLGLAVTQHSKLPDIVFLVPHASALILVEVVSSRGPVSPKRWEELEVLFSECSMRKIYVSVFPTFAEFKRHMRDIAWDTEVWLAEVPDHMIHYNGDKFLGVSGRHGA